MLKSRGHDLRVKGRVVGPLVLLGLLMAISSLTLFGSYNYMDAGIASTLLFVYPIMVALIMTIFFKEKIKLQTVLCILGALGGIWLLYKNSDGSTLSLKGTILVFISSLSYALYLVGVNHKKLQDVPTLKVTFYVLVFGMSVFAIRLISGVPLIMPDKWYLWANVIALALFPTAISFICTTTAIKYIGSTPTAILGALEPVTAIIIGILVFGERLSPRECVGLALILLAVTLVIAGGKITAQLLRFRKLFPKIPKKNHNK